LFILSVILFYQVKGWFKSFLVIAKRLVVGTIFQDGFGGFLRAGYLAFGECG
jgi:hypothetical protein